MSKVQQANGFHNEKNLKKRKKKAINKSFKYIKEREKGSKPWDRNMNKW